MLGPVPYWSSLYDAQTVPSGTFLCVYLMTAYDLTHCMTIQQRAGQYGTDWRAF